MGGGGGWVLCARLGSRGGKFVAFSVGCRRCERRIVDWSFWWYIYVCGCDAWVGWEVVVVLRWLGCMNRSLFGLERVYVG